MTTTRWNGKEYDDRHGGPFDRGGADSYYRRPRRPHYFQGDTYSTVEITKLTPEELDAYNAGYDENEYQQCFKDYG